MYCTYSYVATYVLYQGRRYRGAGGTQAFPTLGGEGGEHPQNTENSNTGKI